MQAAATRPSETLERFGRFELLRRVDAGGMGEIFIARSDGENRLVAVKRLLPRLAKDPTFVGMFKDEARLALKLTHENICRVFETGEIDGSCFLVMEWVDGLSLRGVLNRTDPRSPIPIGIAARIAVDVARALAYAHELQDDDGESLNIVHRDVSPGNIMLSKSGTVKLLDFGLAKARSQVHKTLPGMVKGKFRYLAPEQTFPNSVDGRADVFALGLCFYEMLTRTPLFSQHREVDTVLALRSHDGPPSVRSVRPDAPEAVDEVLRRALAGDPGSRFQDANEMAAALEALCQDVGSDDLRSFVEQRMTAKIVPAEETPPTVAPALQGTGPGARGLGTAPVASTAPPPPRPGRRRWWLVAGGVLVAVVAAVALAL